MYIYIHIQTYKHTNNSLSSSSSSCLPSHVSASASFGVTVRVGASILVAGTAIYNPQQSVAEAMDQLRSCISGLAAE